MLLYGLAELEADGPLRQFTFANWRQPQTDQGST
jgi:hypothetical protein